MNFIKSIFIISIVFAFSAHSQIAYLSAYNGQVYKYSKLKSFKIIESRFIENMDMIYTKEKSQVALNYIPSSNLNAKVILDENTKVNFISYIQKLENKEQHINTLNLIQGSVEIYYIAPAKSNELFFIRYKDYLIIPKAGSMFYFATGILNDDFIVIPTIGMVEVIKYDGTRVATNGIAVENKNNKITNLDVEKGMEKSMLYIWLEQQEKRIMNNFINEYKDQLNKYLYLKEQFNKVYDVLLNEDNDTLARWNQEFDRGNLKDLLALEKDQELSTTLNKNLAYLTKVLLLFESNYNSLMSIYNSLREISLSLNEVEINNLQNNIIPILDTDRFFLNKRMMDAKYILNIYSKLNNNYLPIEFSN